MYLFVFELCWVFTAAQPFLGCRRGLLPRAALHHGGGELLSISGLWGGLLPITGGCSPSWGVSGAALHLWFVGRSAPHRWGLLFTTGVGSCSPSQGAGRLLSISGHCSIGVPEPLLLWSPGSGARLSNCDAQSLLSYRMWSLPRPGIKATPPVLAGWFSATGPPGMSSRSLLMVRL